MRVKNGEGVWRVEAVVGRRKRAAPVEPFCVSGADVRVQLRRNGVYKGEREQSEDTSFALSRRY